MDERKQAIKDIANIIANSVETTYSDEKQDVIDDLYTMGGQSQYIEDMLYNNGIEEINDYVDIIDDGLSLDELTELANLVIEKLEGEDLEEGKQELLNEINEDLDFDKEIKDLENEIKEIDNEIKEKQKLIIDYNGENENFAEEVQNEIDDLYRDKEDCLKEIETLKKDKKDSIKTEDLDSNEDLELNIEQANGETEQDLEKVEASTEELTNDIKFLMDCEKDKISKYNWFLDNYASKLPREVYEVIEDEINDMKNKSIENQEILNKIHSALGFIIDPTTNEESTDEVIEVADDNMDDVFDSLKEEGKLHFNNFKQLAEEYSMYKGTETTEKQIRKSMLENYSILEDKAYTLISSEGIRNKLKLEAKIQSQKELTDKVKKEAEENAKETGEDTYVYQIGDDIFFATEKPTHTALFNKALVIGKYKVSTNGKDVTTTWFEESKEKEYKYKKTLTEGTLQDNKTIEDPNESEAIKEIEKEASKDHEGKIPKGTTVESPANGSTITEDDKDFERFVKGLLDSGAIDDPDHYNKLDDNGKKELVKHYMNDSDVKADWKKVNESKEKEIVEEIGEDYEKISFEDYKKRNKEFIELCYRNTWGEGEIDKDLYDELANSIYTDSITGNIDTKEGYSSLVDKIEDAKVETINDQGENK